MIQHDHIKNIVSLLPDSPGVYLMKDAERAIIYIGKASSLKKRVSSYFQNTNRDPKTSVLVKFINDIEYIATNSEIEALVLESNLIKKHKPKYNIRLKDDKRYPYIAVTLEDEYPRVIYTRKLMKNKNRYFGPYTDAKAARKTVWMINSIFTLKTCTREIPLKKNERPCLNYQMKRCSGVCTGDITRAEYLGMVDNAIRFLEGHVEPVIRDLHARMNSYAEGMNYEKAARVRDIIYNIQTISERQNVDLPVNTDQDFVGLSIFGDEAVLVLFEFRGGVMLGRKISIFGNTEYAGPGEIVQSFLLDYYERSEVPHKIVLQHRIPDGGIIEKFLQEKTGRKVALAPPASRDEKGVIGLIQKNIDMIAADRQAHGDYLKREKGLQELKEALTMERPPQVIECFDISNFHGKDAVASMVVFHDGLPDKSGYRRYRIRGGDTPNDPAMIHEVVSRRVQHLTNENLDKPDLMVIDGGKGQLGRAVEASKNFDLGIMIISIAKNFEEIYTTGSGIPIRLPDDSPGLAIIKHIRDEAHRFAVTYHRNLRDKKTTLSELDRIPGIGPAAKKILLNHFKSISAIRKATIEQLMSVKGIGEKTAREIHAYFAAVQD